ncbi:MAG: hypothetical protein ACYCSO_09930 [Cuniculiplasma sp.]
MSKKEIKEIGGLISGFSISSILNQEIVKEIEKILGHVMVSHIHLDVVDENGKDVEDIILLYRSKKERKERTATLLCDNPTTFSKLIDVIDKIE